MSAPDKQLSAEQSPRDKMKRFRPRLTTGMLVLAVSMIDWLVALVWITYLLIVSLVSWATRGCYAVKWPHCLDCRSKQAWPSAEILQRRNAVSVLSIIVGSWVVLNAAVFVAMTLRRDEPPVGWENSNALDMHRR